MKSDDWIACVNNLIDIDELQFGVEKNWFGAVEQDVDVGFGKSGVKFVLKSNYHGLASLHYFEIDTFSCLASKQHPCSECEMGAVFVNWEIRPPPEGNKIPFFGCVIAFKSRDEQFHMFDKKCIFAFCEWQEKNGRKQKATGD